MMNSDKLDQTLPTTVAVEPTKAAEALHLSDTELDRVAGGVWVAYTDD